MRSPGSSATAAICRTCIEIDGDEQRTLTQRTHQGGEPLPARNRGGGARHDRDLRGERTKKKLEKAFAFMIRLRLPGGVCTPSQWLALDRIARDYANGSLRLTTRQTFQFHGIIKSNLRTAMQAIDAALLDTLAACGDVNRNVLATSNLHRSRVHSAALELAHAISDHLLPHTPAYREIWLDGEKIVGGEDREVVEPI